LERKKIFLVAGLWKSGKKEGFRVLDLRKWVMIVRIAGRRQGHDVFIVFFIWDWVNFIWDKPHLIKEVFGNAVQPAFPKNLKFFFLLKFNMFVRFGSF
jgi:hypothetical protein